VVLEVRVAPVVVVLEDREEVAVAPDFNHYSFKIV